MEPDEIPLPDVCDLCGQLLDEETELLALVDDSSAIHTSDPKMDGKRLVTVCSPEHLKELQRQYAERSFSEPELWSGKIARAMRTYPNGIKPVNGHLFAPVAARCSMHSWPTRRPQWRPDISP
ncbi:hypothetical protein ACFU95_43130, partial [Streptomyces sp. NPDC057623]